MCVCAFIKQSAFSYMLENGTMYKLLQNDLFGLMSRRNIINGFQAMLKNICQVNHQKKKKKNSNASISHSQQAFLHHHIIYETKHSFVINSFIFNEKFKHLRVESTTKCVPTQKGNHINFSIQFYKTISMNNWPILFVCYQQKSMHKLIPIQKCTISSTNPFLFLFFISFFKNSSSSTSITLKLQTPSCSFSHLFKYIFIDSRRR